MAQNYLGLNRGNLDRAQDVAGGSATTGTDIEVRWDTTKNLTRKDVVLALATITRMIESNGIGSATGYTYIPAK